MIKTHELKMHLEMFNALAEGQDYLIIEQSVKKYEKSDFVLLIATNNNVDTGQTLMTQIQYINADEKGLNSNHVLLKLNTVK